MGLRASIATLRKTASPALLAHPVVKAALDSITKSLGEIARLPAQRFGHGFEAGLAFDAPPSAVRGGREADTVLSRMVTALDMGGPTGVGPRARIKVPVRRLSDWMKARDTTAPAGTSFETATDLEVSKDGRRVHVRRTVVEDLPRSHFESVRGFRAQRGAMTYLTAVWQERPGGPSCVREGRSYRRPDKERGIGFDTIDEVKQADGSWKPVDGPVFREQFPKLL